MDAAEQYHMGLDLDMNMVVTREEACRIIVTDLDFFCSSRQAVGADLSRDQVFDH